MSFVLQAGSLIGGSPVQVGAFLRIKPGQRSKFAGSSAFTWATPAFHLTFFALGGREPRRIRAKAAQVEMTDIVLGLGRRSSA